MRTRGSTPSVGAIRRTPRVRRASSPALALALALSLGVLSPSLLATGGFVTVALLALLLARLAVLLVGYPAPSTPPVVTIDSV